MNVAPPPRIQPQVAVVTGATSGIGKEVARRLASRGWITVVVGRGTERAAAVARELATATRNPRVESVPVNDLAVRAQMKQVAAELLRRYPAIHVLINNAGGYFARRELTSDGLERTFALNVLAPFVLTSLLADRLRVSSPARVVQVASAAHLGYSVDLGDLQGATHFDGFGAYGRSKLELILLTRELARRLAGWGVTVNAVHPGFVRSGFGGNNLGGAGLGIRLGKLLFARSLAYGTRAPLFAATDPTLASITGEYISRGRVATASAASYDMEVAQKLYEICRDLAGTPDLPDPATVAPSAGSSAPGRTGQFAG